jgi:hypothetical protein
MNRSSILFATLVAGVFVCAACTKKETNPLAVPETSQNEGTSSMSAAAPKSGDALSLPPGLGKPSNNPSAQIGDTIMAAETNGLPKPRSSQLASRGKRHHAHRGHGKHHRKGRRRH